MASHGIQRGVRERDVEKERKSIVDYRDLLHQVNSKIQEQQYTQEVLHLISKILKKNPEYYTIWNHRRLVLLNHFQHQAAVSENDKDDTDPRLSPLSKSNREVLTGDLQFVIPLLIEYPKCYWIWNYRLWLLEQSERHLVRSTVRQLWEEELGLVGKMLARDERNFHGWGYRRTVVIQLERLAEGLNGKSQVEQEFAYTTKMIKSALQNFSALHYRSKLIPKLLDERQADGAARRKLLEEELNTMQDALIDPFNQSAWFYHQHLTSTLSLNCPRDVAIVLDLSHEERLHYYKQELERINEMLEDFDDCKWIYEALIRLSADYNRLKGLTPSNKGELRLWLGELCRLDPLRAGRWDDLQASLELK